MDLVQTPTYEALEALTTRAEPQPVQITYSEKLSKFFDSIGSPDAFSKGKYKGQTFKEVLAKDPQYIKYLVKECRIYTMRADINNLVKWLEDNITFI